VNLATGHEDADRVTAGATPLWEWIGDGGATVFSY
jgi:hypothetical protein